LEDLRNIATRTLSIPKWMDEFLEENPSLSPSKLLQSKITEIHERYKHSDEKTRNLQRKLNFLQSELQKKGDECEELKNVLEKERTRERGVSEAEEGTGGTKD
jgi:predicted RNase H-like nuclease (RuvC/YqgF family)